MTAPYTTVSTYQLESISTGPIMSNYSNPSDSWRTTSFVTLAHSISKSDFSPNKAYAVSVATMPGILTGLGVLSLLCFLLGMLFRCCPVTCFCCKCYPHTNPRDSDEKKAVSVQCQRRAVLAFFYMFLIFSLTTNQLSFVGHANIALAVAEFGAEVNHVQVVFANITGTATALTSAGVLLQTSYQAAQTSCGSPATTVAAAGVSTFTTSVSQFAAAVAPVKSNLELLTKYLVLYAVQYEQAGFYVLWSLGSASGCALIISQILKRKQALKWSVFLGAFTFLVEVVVCLFFLLATAALGDVCTKPSFNILTNVPTGSLQNMAAYYSSCRGVNTVGVSVNNAMASAMSLSEGIQVLVANATASSSMSSSKNSTIAAGACFNDPNLLNMQSELQGILGLIASANQNMICPPLQRLWFAIVNTAICTDLFTGFYALWVSQLITSLFLFLAIMLGSISWQYYDLPVMGYAVYIPAGSAAKVAITDGSDTKAVDMGVTEQLMLEMGSPDDVQAFGIKPPDESMRADVAIFLDNDKQQSPIDPRYK